MTKESLVRRRLVPWGGLLLAVALAAAPEAQGVSMSPATEQAIRSYTLDQGKAEGILKTLKELTAATLKDPNWMQKIPARMKLPFEEQWTAMESDPVSGPVFKANVAFLKANPSVLERLRAIDGGK
jgi:hypothetical protein